MIRDLERHLIQRRLRCQQIEVDYARENFEDSSRDALYDAVIYAAAAYIQAGRGEDGASMAELERQFYTSYEFMSAETDEVAKDVLRKQRGLDDHELILFVLKNHDRIEPRFQRHRTAISTVWHILVWKTSFY